MRNEDCCVLAIRVSPETRRLVRQMAAKRDTSMSSMARDLVARGLEAYREGAAGPEAPGGKGAA